MCLYVCILYACVYVLLLLLLSKSLQSCPTCATPETAAHQAPPSPGFSRQEHWSGLPFPSPVHESETWKWSLSVVSDSSQPHGLQPRGSSVPGILQARVLEWGAVAFCICVCITYICFHTAAPSILYSITEWSYMRA